MACGREEGEEEGESSFVLCSLQAILSLCPPLTLGCGGAKFSTRVSPHSWGEGCYLFSLGQEGEYFHLGANSGVAVDTAG